MMRGLVMAAGGVLVAACSSDGSGSGADAGPADASADAPNAFTYMCGANLCVNLKHPSAAALGSVGGNIIVTAPADMIFILRQSQTAYVTLSDLCTHEFCGVGYNSSLKQLTCPCHGARFSLTGAVVQGPARTPLRNYVNSVDTNAQVLTITL